MRSASRLGAAVALVGAALPLAALACAGRGPDAAPAPAAATVAEGDSVSVGYGRRARHVTSAAVSSVTPEEIEHQSVRHVADLIQGRMPGVQVLRRAGGAVSLRVRGAVGTGFQSGEALLVVDGLQIVAGAQGAALDGLNPNDIHRIEVLKDVGSTAIYGLRGAHGVVLITTKHARR